MAADPRIQPKSCISRCVHRVAGALKGSMIWERRDRVFLRQFIIFDISTIGLGNFLGKIRAGRSVVLLL
jgi:hypothetical protein